MAAFSWASALDVGLGLIGGMGKGSGARAQASANTAIREANNSIQRSATVITPVAETVTEGLVPYAWIKGHEMRIEQVPAEGQLVILDAVGRAIEVRTLTGNHVETFTLRSDGVYAVSITTPQNQYILKVVTQ